MTSNEESFFILFISDIMKMRYLFIPMIIISLMLWIIDIDKDVLVNKEIINDNIEINYPYFNDNKIDNFINEYLDRYKDKNGIIDYDYDNNDNKHIISLNKKEKIEKAIINKILNDFKNQSLKKMPI